MEKGQRNKRIATIATASLALLVVLAAINHDAIMRTIVGYMVDRSKETAAEQIGKELPPEFLVTAHGQARPAPLRSLIGAGAVVMLHRHGCPACDEAIEYYRVRYIETGVTHKNGFYVLSFDDDAPPSGLDPSHYLHAAGSRRGTLFDTGITPTFWEFAADAKVVAREVGFSVQDMGALLEGKPTLASQGRTVRSNTQGLNGQANSSL